MQTGRTADAGHPADDQTHTGLSSFRSDQEQQQQQQRHQYYHHGDQGTNGSVTAASNGTRRSMSDTSESHDGQGEDGQDEQLQSSVAPSSFKPKAHPIGESQQQRVSASAYASNAEPYTTLPPPPQSSPPHPSPANTFASYAARANHLSANDDRDGGNSNGGHTTPGALNGITNAMSGANVSSAHHQAHSDQMSMSQQQSGQFMVAPSGASHGSTAVSPANDGATVPSHHHGGSGLQFNSSMTPFAQSAPPSVTSFGMHSSVQSPTHPNPGGMYPPNYYPPPHTSSAPHSFMLQQQQQHHPGQGHNGYVNAHGQLAAPDSFSSPYFYAQSPHPMTGYYDMEGKLAAHSEQVQQGSVAPTHHYHPYAGAEVRRAHPRNASPPILTATGPSAQGHFVPSQGYRGGGNGNSNNFHASGVTPQLNAMSIFTANPNNLPDVRFSDQPLNPGSQYGRLPDGKIIELFPAMMRTIQACEYCRSRKAKCTGGLPCERCNKKNIKCEYAQLDKKRKVKTTTSEYDMSAGGAGAGSPSSKSYSGSINTRAAQAMLSAKVGLATNKVKHGRAFASGSGSGGSNAVMDLQHSYDGRPTFESANAFGVGQWSNSMDDGITQHAAPKFTVPLPSSGNMFEQEGSSSFGSYDSMPLGDPRKRAIPSSPSAYPSLKANSPPLGHSRARKSTRFASNAAKDGDEQGCTNALGLYT